MPKWTEWSEPERIDHITRLPHDQTAKLCLPSPASLQFFLVKYTTLSPLEATKKIIMKQSEKEKKVKLLKPHVHFKGAPWSF